MKTHNLFTTMLLFVAGLCLTVSQAMATPSVDTLNVQGYMKKANGAAVTDGTYNMAIGVFQNGSAIWAKQYAVVVSNGLFAQALTGAGSDLSSTVPAGTGMRTNYLSATLNPALLSGGAAGEVSIRVYAITAIDGANPQFDIALGATPTAYVAALAQGVEAGSVTLTGIATGSKSAVGGAGAANKIALLDGSGLLDLTMIPALPASQVSSGQVGVGNGGTGTSTGSITGTGSVTYQSAGGSTTTIGNNSTTSTVVLRSGTGGISGAVTGTTGDVSFTAGTTSGNILLTPGTSSGSVTIGTTSSSGLSVFGNAGGASSTTIQSGTGHILLSPAGTGVVRVTNGNGLNLVNGTGSITINSPSNPTSYTLTLPSAAGTSGQILSTTGSGVTQWSTLDLTATGSSVLAIANGGTNNGSLAVTAGGLLYTDGSKVANVGVGTTSQILMSFGSSAPAWTTLNISALGGAASGSNTDITSLNPTGTLSLGGAATTSVHVQPTGTNASVLINSNGSGALTVGSTGTGAATFGNTGASSVTTIQSGSSADINLTAGTGGYVTLNNANGLKLVNGTGNITVSSPLNPTSWSMVLPSSAGSGNQVLMTDGFGTTSWAALSLSSSGVTGTLPVLNGGTGATTASGARTSLGAAASGANSDITSLTNLNAVTYSGQLTSTVATGTAPLVVASTTNVANLNASSLNGATFAAPGAIGGTTPAAGTFTTVNATTMNTVGMPNNATGTANNKIAILTSTGLQTAATTTTTNIVGIVASGAGTSGTAQVVTQGIVNCQFDTSVPTAGHYAAVSTATAGACMDVGTSASAAGTIIGMITTTGAASSLSPVLVGPIGSMPITQVSVQTKTSSGTYTPTAGTQYVIMEGVAPGGGGGGVTAVAGAVAAGGGSGSYFKILCPVTQFTGAGVVTINAVGTAGTTAGAAGGNGGTVTVTLAGATTVTANGGSGGAGSTAASTCKAGGAGGAISTNTNANCTNLMLIPGQPGQNSTSSTTAPLSAAGHGAMSLMGPGGLGPAGATGTGGTPTGYGGGGGGAAGATASAGGAGAPGVVIFTEYRAF